MSREAILPRTLGASVGTGGLGFIVAVSAAVVTLVVAPWPFARLAAGALLLTILPGWGLLRSFGRGVAPTFLEAVPFAFALSFVLITPAACVAYFARVGTSTAATMLLAAATTGIGLGVIRARGGAMPDSGQRTLRVVLGIAMAAVAAFAYRHAGVPYADPRSDVWFHLGYVRKLTALGIADPGNPFLRGDGVEFVYGYNVWHLVLAVLGRWAGVDPLEAWAYAVPLLAFVFLATVVPFASALFGFRIAVASGFVYLLTEVVVKGAETLTASPKPASIAIWVFPLLVLALVVRYARAGGCPLLIGAALLNVVPAAIHFVEPLGVVVAVGIAATAAVLWSEDRDAARRLWRAFAVLTVVVIAAFAAKAVFLAGQSGGFTEWAPHQPIRFPFGLSMIDPYSSPLRDPIMVAGLLMLPLLFSGLRSDVAVQFFVLVPVVYLLIQHHPVPASVVGRLTGDVFVRKALSFLHVFGVVAVAVGLVHAGPIVAARVAAWLRAGRARRWRRGDLAAVALGLVAITALAVYMGYVGGALERLGRGHLEVRHRHLLKTLLVGPGLLVVLSAVGLLTAIELVRPVVGPMVRRRVADVRIVTRGPMVTLTIGTLLVLAATGFVLDRGLRRAGSPLPTDVEAVIPPDLRYLRDAEPSPVVVLLKPSDDGFDSTTNSLKLQAFTPHYGVAMPDPDYKRTRSTLDYAQRFRDVRLLYSGAVSHADVVRVARTYDVRYIVAARGDSSRPLFDVLAAAPHDFPVVHDVAGTAVFRVRRP